MSKIKCIIIICCCCCDHSIFSLLKNVCQSPHLKLFPVIGLRATCSSVRLSFMLYCFYIRQLVGNSSRARPFEQYVQTKFGHCLLIVTFSRQSSLHYLTMLAHNHQSRPQQPQQPEWVNQSFYGFCHNLLFVLGSSLEASRQTNL